MAQVKSNVAWWAKSRIGPGIIPNTMVKATDTPMTTAVSGGTDPGPRSVTAPEGGASVRTRRLVTTSSPAVTPAGAVPSGPATESPIWSALPIGPTGENMVT